MNLYGSQYPWYQAPAPYNPHVYIPPRYNDPYYQTASAWSFFDRTQSLYPNLNPALAADKTNVRYDLRKPPRDGGILFSTYQQIAHQPAFARPTQDLRIISKSFPWSLDVRMPAGSVVTCGSVFDGLYAMLQEPILDSEWGIILVYESSSISRKETVEKAAKARQAREKDNKNKIVLKRIDWLGENTAFNGLERDEGFEKKRLLPGEKECKETWVIKLGKP